MRGCNGRKGDSLIQVYLLRRDTGQRVGEVQFKTLLVNGGSDFSCQPAEILSLEQVQAIAAKLRHLPQINSGTVGEYQWREVGT